MKRAAVLVALGLAFPADVSTGSTRHGIVTAKRSAHAAQIANRTWHRPCGKVRVEIKYQRLSGGAAARATRWKRGGRTVRCLVEFAPWATGTWGRYCTARLHEYGHLAGRDHSRNRRSVMFPRILEVDHRCR